MVLAVRFFSCFLLAAAALLEEDEDDMIAAAGLLAGWLALCRVVWVDRWIQSEHHKEITEI